MSGILRVSVLRISGTQTKIKAKYSSDSYFGRTQTNVQMTRKLIMQKTLHPTDDIDRLFMFKKEEEYSPALKITFYVLLYKDTMTILKRAKKD